MTRTCMSRDNETISLLSAGLYLYLLVVETFSRIEVINKFVIYAVIGYGECRVVFASRELL